MSGFSSEELLSAKKAFLSWQKKITKVRETLSGKNPLPKSQLTLALNNLDAIDTALRLIDNELAK